MMSQTGEKRVAAGNASDGPARHFFLKRTKQRQPLRQRVAAPVRPNDWRDHEDIDRDHEEGSSHPLRI
jgi:hypothetical protein